MATLVNRWRFENNLTDSIGSNNGTLIGGGYTASSYEGTYALDKNSKATFSSIDSLFCSSTAKFSIICWIYSISNAPSPGDVQAILYASHNVDADYGGIYFQISHSYHPVVLVQYSDSTVKTYSYSSTTVPLSSYNKFEIQYDYSQTNNRIKLYYNDVLLTPDSYPTAPSLTLKSLSQFGVGYVSVNETFYIDDLRIYNLAEDAVTTYSNRSYSCIPGSTSYTYLMWYKGSQTQWGIITKIGELGIFLGTPSTTTKIGLGNNTVNIKDLGSNIEDGSWHLIVLKNNAGTFSASVDAGSFSSTFTAPDSNFSDLSKTNKIQIGGNKTFDTYDVRLYNKVLTQGQIDYYYDQVHNKINPLIWEY